ncbi:MAG: ATP-dependent DNA helicase RecQ [Clostridia bacterium]|nr:ATP-dependent DNA helicase RecQ [Clostridia bacterium]
MTKEDVLRRFFGHSAFRPLQSEIIDSLLSGQDTLAVLPTGAGKSVCFQVPALMKPGVTLVISPLVALMKDQVRALQQNGIPAAFLSAGMSEHERDRLFRRLRRGECKLLYIAPERLRSPRFLALLRELTVPFLVVDEAHCVSQWGHDFRPAYLEISGLINKMPVRPVVCACTATATARVRDDICASLQLQNANRFVASFDRANLFLSVRRVTAQTKYGVLRQYLQKYALQSGIVYCATRRTVDELFARLSAEGFSVCRYHAGLSLDERKASQEAFMADEKRVILCTNAFGMGIDKRNVAFVVHVQMPADLESYYQEAGRAGRDGKKAACVLLYDPHDLSLQRFLIEHAAQDGKEDAHGALQQRLRLARLQQMRDYACASTCLRKVLLRYFGEDAPERCGYCAVCCAQKEQAVSAPAPAAPQPDRALLGRLVMLTKRIAQINGVPPFAVFTNRTLEHMAACKPKTAQEFAALDGVSERKAQKYAAIFLKEILKSNS